MMIQKENKIGDVVAENFRTAKIFEGFGLDFCCGGKKTIEEGCIEKGINPDSVITELSRDSGSTNRNMHYDKWELEFLADYIVNNHHSYVLNAIPSIEQHLHKVVSKHGDNHPELLKIFSIFTALKDELLTHMAKEEKMLFPYIKKMRIAELNALSLQVPPFGTVDNPVKVMETEHEHAGNMMKEISRLTNNYAPPEGACSTFKVLYSELKEFEQDLHTHVHLENNILFPKAVELELRLKQS